MKIALLSSVPVPRVFGGQDRLLDGLSAALRELHPTDLVTIPVDERSVEGVMRGYYDFYNLDVSGYDLVISYKAPSYMVRHPVHVLYLSHRLRVFYDLYEPRDQQHARLRRLIHWMDNWAMSSERLPYIYTVGNAVSKRLRIWGGIPSTPIHHPTTFKPAEPQPGAHFFTVGRLHPWKRFDLIIEAMRKSKAEVPLLIAGSGPDEPRLRDIAANDPRIQFLGMIDENQLRDCYARAIATIFPPINEDLGMVTFESFLSGKPVLTTIDAGEPADIVKPGKTGFITQPTPEAMAERLDWMERHPHECEAMTANCLAHMRDITWERLVTTILTSAEKIQSMRGRVMIPADLPASEGEPGAGHGGVISSGTRSRVYHLLVTDNQIIDPPVGGGRIRIWELYRHLPDDFTTTYIGTHDHPGPLARDQWLAPNFREIIMPLTTVHFKMHEVWRRLTRGDATIDVTIPLLLGRCSPRYPRLIAEHLPKADALIYAHPWVFPWLPAHPTVPRIYDSQNVEALLKFALLRRTLAGRRLAQRVEETERAAIEAARLTLACSSVDRDEFVRRYGVPSNMIRVVPNGVDCARYSPLSQSEKRDLRVRLGLAAEQPLAVFVGSQYGPNLDATDLLIRQVASAVPELTIGLVGGAGEAWRDQHPSEPLPENIRVFGTLEPGLMNDVLNAAEFGLNPMATGSGTNIKMLDYMAAGLTIVTTAIGARGLEGQAGMHWHQADLPAFVQAVRELLPDGSRRTGLAERARRLAETRYDWPLIARDFADALRPLLEPSPAAVGGRGGEPTVNILIVSSYPPMACGIGKYAEQQVMALRNQGHRVDVLSPPEGEGDFQEDLLGEMRILRLLKYLWAYDEVFIHYTPQFFYLSEDRRSRFKTSFAFLFLMLLAGRRISVLLHETGFKIGVNEKGRLRYKIDRIYWSLARRVIFHSYREREGFGAYYDLEVNKPRFQISPPEIYYVRHCSLNQAEARRQLNVPSGVTLLLCIGFIQPHKGFDRAIRALAQVDAPNLHLRVVGSVRLIWDRAHQYAHLLHDLADADPRVQVHEAYLSDELFDTWIVAADYIVVPYQEIWTSGVAARSKIYNRPVIASNIGSLAEQMTPGSALFSSDEELADVFRHIATGEAGPAEAVSGGLALPTNEEPRREPTDPAAPLHAAQA